MLSIHDKSELVLQIETFFLYIKKIYYEGLRDQDMKNIKINKNKRQTEKKTKEKQKERKRW